MCLSGVNLPDTFSQIALLSFSGIRKISPRKSYIKLGYFPDVFPV